MRQYLLAMTHDTDTRASRFLSRAKRNVTFRCKSPLSNNKIFQFWMCADYALNIIMLTEDVSNSYHESALMR